MPIPCAYTNNAPNGLAAPQLAHVTRAQASEESMWSVPRIRSAPTLISRGSKTLRSDPLGTVP